MARLPQPGADNGAWGDILNNFLITARNTDGTLKPIGSSSLQDGAVTTAKIAATLNEIPTAVADVSLADTSATNVGTATAPQDLASKTYVDDKLTRTGDQMEGQLGEAVVVLDDDTTITINASLGNVFTVTISDDRTIANPTNPTSGQKITLRIKQDAGGGRAVTWGSAFRFSTDVPQPTLTTNPNSFDYLRFVYNNAATKWDCISTVLAIPDPSTPSAGTMTLAGTHPISTGLASGHGLHTLMPYNSKLFVGYGDYSDFFDIGPIDIYSWDGDSWVDEQHTTLTESIEQMYVFNGNLFVAATDPDPNTASYDFDVLSGSTWSQYRMSGGASEALLHNFSMVYFDGKYWVAGSARSTGLGVVYSSSSLAGPWTNYPFTGDVQGRMYGLWHLNGVLYALDSDKDVHVWNGSTWSENGWELPFVPGRCRTFNNMMVYTPSIRGGVNNASLRSIDANGVVATYASAGATYDVWPEGSYMYILADGNTSNMCVMRSTNLSGWEFVAIAPSNGESLAIMDNTIYVGTTDGELYSIAHP